MSPVAAFSHTAASLLFALAEIAGCASMACLQIAALFSAFASGGRRFPVDPLLGAVVPPAGVLVPPAGVLVPPAGVLVAPAGVLVAAPGAV